jgi:hypothetical protein
VSSLSDADTDADANTDTDARAARPADSLGGNECDQQQLYGPLDQCPQCYRLSVGRINN